MAKILITGQSIAPEILQKLTDAGHEFLNPTAALDADELERALDGAIAWLKGGPEAATARALENAIALKHIAFFGMGFESSVDIETARRLGVAVTITKDALSDAMADATIGLVLSATRRLHAQASRFKQGRGSDGVKRRDLRALDIGILGMGGSGARIAEVLRQGFGARVSYHSRTRKPELEARLSMPLVSLDELVAQSDVLIVIAALNASTHGLLGRDTIARAKPGQILVNTARPQIVDPEALLWGLSQGPLDYAAFDGVYAEPPETVAALMALAPDKLMVTPHLGSLTHEARDAMGAKAVASILNFIATGDDQDRVV